MAGAWELILHHTYSGVPGVIFDHSPSRRSHGQAVNLSDADFTADGASPGSGAIRFPSRTAMIRVPASESWNPLGGVRFEMTCETELLRAGGALVTADSFAFTTGGGYFGGEFTHTDGGGSAYGRGGSEPRPLPTDRWLTVALQFTPVGMQAEINGDVVARWEGWTGLLSGTAGLVIGNDRTGHNGVTGLIDDVKIFRLEPHFIGRGFVDRPVTTEVGRCWAEWSRRLDEFIRDNPDCWNTLSVLLPRAMFTVMNQIDALPNIDVPFHELTSRYQQLWSEGRLSEMPAVLADLVALLRDAGLDPVHIADLQALLNDPCFASIAEYLPIDCDGEFIDLFASVGESF